MLKNNFERYCVNTEDDTEMYPCHQGACNLDEDNRSILWYIHTVDYSAAIKKGETSQYAQKWNQLQDPLLGRKSKMQNSM